MQDAAVLARPAQRRRDVGRDHEDRRPRGPRLAHRAQACSPRPAPSSSARRRDARSPARSRPPRTPRPARAARPPGGSKTSRSASHNARLWTPGSPKHTSTPACSNSSTMTCAPVDIGDARYLTISLKNAADRPTAGGVIRRTALLPHRPVRRAARCGSVSFAATGEPRRPQRDPGHRGPRDGGAGAAAARATARGWGLLALSNAAWAIGDFDPFKLNAFYLVSYVFAHAGLVILVAAQARVRWRTALALDGVVAGLAAATLLTSFVSTALEGTGVRVPATALAGDADARHDDRLRVRPQRVAARPCMVGDRRGRDDPRHARPHDGQRRRPDPRDARRLGRRLPGHQLRRLSPRDRTRAAQPQRGFGRGVPSSAERSP